MKTYEEILKRNREWYEKNKEKRILDIREYAKNNKHLRNLRKKIRSQSDPQYLIKLRLVSKLYSLLKGKSKSSRIEKYFGCSFNELKAYLESKFQKGMEWNNYGKWHIDHITPYAKFDLTKEVELYKLMNYKNLQPLWAKDNIKKANK